MAIRSAYAITTHIVVFPGKRMGFVFRADEIGRSRIVVTDEPSYVVALPIAPTCIEECLKLGKWLVVGVSVWSIHEVDAAHRAVAAVRSYKGRISVGLRPINSPQEMSTWVPGLNTENITERHEVKVAEQAGVVQVTIQRSPDAGPFWLSLCEGTVRDVRFGQLADSEILELLSKLA